MASDLIKTGQWNKVPLILGHTNNEALLFVPLTRLGMSLDITNYEDLVPKHFGLQENSDSSKQIAKKIKEFYNSLTNTNEDMNLMVSCHLFSSKILFSESKFLFLFYFACSYEVIYS